MSAAEFTRFDELVSRHLDDTLAAAEAAELVALLGAPPLAARFLEATRLNAEIAGLLAAPVPDAAMVELVRTDIERSLAGRWPAGGTRWCLVGRPQPRAPAAGDPAAPRRPARRTLAWAAAFAVFASLAALLLIHRTAFADAAVVASARGELRLLGARGERLLRTGDSWQRGETLETVGAHSTAAITFRDGTRLDLAGNSVVINQTTRQGRRVELRHGDVRGWLRRQPGGHSFVFATPAAEVVVVGTKLRLVAGASHTRLEVTEGEAHFRRRDDGAEVAVKAGYYAVAAPHVPLVAKPLHAEPHHVP